MDNPLFFNNTKQINMRVILTFCLLLSLSLTSYSQLFNDGATIVVESGAVLHVETDITNSNGGTITNSGTIEVTGNFTNNATYTANSSNIRFIGATAATVKTNGDVFNNVEINKSAGDITLTDDMGLSGVLNWAGNGVIVTGANKVDVQNSAAGAITGYTSARYINGNLTRDVVNGGDYPLPVGDGSAMRLAEIENIQGATELDAAFSAGVAGTTPLNIATEGIYTDVNSFGKWTISSTGTATSYDVKAHTTGFTGLVDNQFGVVKRATGSASSADWGTGGGAFVAHTTADGFAERTGVTDGFSEFAIATGADAITPGIKVDLKAFLAGAYTGASAMSTNLSTFAVLPLTDPYGLGVTVTSIPANAVDWVKIGIWNGTASTSEVAATAGFLLSDGTIVDAQSGSAVVNLNYTASEGPFYLNVDHRNHLPVLSDLAIVSSASKFTHDFSGGAAFNTLGGTQKDLGSGVFGLIPGDAAPDNFLATDDITLVVSDQGAVLQYLISDVNLDGFVATDDITIVVNEQGKFVLFF